MICQTMLKGPRTAARHKKKYHSDGDYPCKKCGSMEIQYYDLKIHMNIVHGDAYVPTEDDEEMEGEETDDEDEFNSGDESEVENRKRKRRRVNSKLKENSKVREKGLRRKRRTAAAAAAAATSNADKNLEKTHICDACGRTFRSGSELKTHYR